jgi:hypothetical protein
MRNVGSLGQMGTAYRIFIIESEAQKQLRGPKCKSKVNMIIWIEVGHWFHLAQHRTYL